jgi:hypothetical protein
MNAPSRPVTFAPLATCGRDGSAAAWVTLAAGQAQAGHAVRRRVCRSPVPVLRTCGGLTAPAVRSAAIVLCSRARNGAGCAGRPGAPRAEPAGQARRRGRATASSSSRRPWAARGASRRSRDAPLHRWARADAGRAAPARAGTAERQAADRSGRSTAPVAGMAAASQGRRVAAVLLGKGHRDLPGSRHLARHPADYLKRA